MWPTLTEFPQLSFSFSQPTFTSVRHSSVGIDIDLVYAASWFLSGGLAGIAGLFAGLLLTGNPDIGIVILPSIFAASVVGGLTNVYGALLGGFITGSAE